LANNHRLKILVFIDWYEPGYKAGGPIRSISNFVAHFQHRYAISIVTGDRDLGDKQPYSGITANEWTQVQACNVMYCSPGYLTRKRIQSLLHNIAPDWVYLNGMFSFRFSILPSLVLRNNRWKPRVIIAPRGMLSRSALQFKKTKKRVFIRLYKMLHGFGTRFFFQATSHAEVVDIEQVLGGNRQVILLPNLLPASQPFQPVADKKLAEAKLIVIGRIHPIKNIHVVLESLQSLTVKLDVTLIGEIDDPSYWSRCKSLIERLPPNVSVTVRSHVEHNAIVDIIRQHHLFVLPTQGENFGHAIFEALHAGRPVLISDQTPWRDLEPQHAGWDLPINDRLGFVEKIKLVASFSTTEMNRWCSGAWNLSRQFIQNTPHVTQYADFFETPRRD
jgi:glycosyltransferase involved in cell wall biosynthesis